MAIVDPSRAALITQPYSIAIEEDPSAPGSEATVVLAIATQGGAAAYLERVAPLALAGLGRWPVVVPGGFGRFSLGEKIRLQGRGFGPADGGLYIVTRVANEPNTFAAVLGLRGPKPED